MDIPRILVPIDFSQDSANALAYACALAPAVHGTLDLLHVAPDPLQQSWAAKADGLDAGTLTEEWMRQATRRMRQFADDHVPHGLTPRLATRLGAPVPNILAYAAETHCDLIIMGAQGHRRATTLLLGTVAERVVRQAPCPVMTVRAATAADRAEGAAAEGDVAGRTPSTILIPTDFSNLSRAAVTYGSTLAEALHARVHVLAVVEAPWTRDLAYTPPSPEAIEDLRRRTEQALSRTLTRLPPAVAAQGIVRAGDPFDQILRVAEEVHADLIVMGTHGRGVAARLVLGGIAQKVLHAAPCPVLTIRRTVSVPPSARRPPRG